MKPPADLADLVAAKRTELEAAGFGNLTAWLAANPPPLSHGDLVRARCGATGRYLGNGLVLYVCAMDNSLTLDEVDRTREPARSLPAPSNRELEACLEGLRWARHVGATS